jgi:dTDP-4-dehydrorhamnose 3,5-epimerase
MPFKFKRLDIPEVVLIEARRFYDDRGHFLESYQQRAFDQAGITARFVQDNASHSRHCILRGLHYQLSPAAQGKLIYAARGEIFDVAVDIRRHSPSFGRCVSATLNSERDAQMLYMPPGFAHGFCVLSDEALVLYKTTANYAPEQERGIRWDDPALHIDWPVPSPIVNERDARLPVLAEAENDFVYSS